MMAILFSFVLFAFLEILRQLAAFYNDIVNVRLPRFFCSVKKAIRFELDCITGTSDEPSSEDSMTNKESKIKKTINRVRAMKITTIQCLLHTSDSETVKHKVVHDSIIKIECQTEQRHACICVIKLQNANIWLYCWSSNVLSILYIT